MGAILTDNNIQMEQLTRSLANTNQNVDVTYPEGIIAEYDEEMPTDQGEDANYIEYQCRKLYKRNNGLCAHQQFCQINDLPE